MNRKKYWITACMYSIAAILFFSAGFLLSHQLLVQKTKTVIDECVSNLKKEQHMLKTWCTHERVRIGQCSDEIYICLCSSPDDFGVTSE